MLIRVEMPINLKKELSWPAHVSTEKRLCARANGLGEEVGYLCNFGNRVSQLASIIILKGFADDALIIPTGSTNTENVLATLGITSLLVNL